MLSKEFFDKVFKVGKTSVIFFSILITTQIAISGAELSFNLAPRYQMGINTLQTRFTDIDGDGFLDIIVVNGGEENPTPTITFRFGTQNGEFSSPMVISSPIIGHTLATGDLNHDGKIDLVVASWYENKIAVFLNQGERQFSTPVINIPPDPPYQGFPYGEFFDLAIADFDGDGNNDVVALQDQINQRLRFLHFSGQGTLTVFTTLDQLGQDTSYERKIAVGDINGDNRPDIVFAGGGPFGTRTFSFVFGQTLGGNLSLIHGFSVPDKAVGISIKDLDNDNDNDLAVAFLDVTTPNRHSLQIFKNNGSGIFTAMPQMFLEYPFPPDDITVDDFNSDGKQDIAALIGSVYDSGVMVLVKNGNGDGTFSGEIYYAVSKSVSIFSHDLNQDNKIDILTSSSLGVTTDYSLYIGLSFNAVTVLYNDNLQKFKAPIVTPWGGNFIDRGDFNNDGYKDFVSSWASSFVATSSVDLLLNDTFSSFLAEQNVTSPKSLTDMKTGDFNGDGKKDAVTAHEDDTRVLAVYLGNGNGNLGLPINTQFTNGLTNILVEDFNSDGKDDVFAIDDLSRGYIMLGNINGSFSMAPDSPIVLPINVPFELQKGDFNNDNKIDIIITSNSDVKLWLGDGNGRLLQSPNVIPQMAHPVPGDFNGDGNLDLAGMTGPIGRQKYLTAFLGNGNGVFANSYFVEIQNLNYYTIESLVAGDFDSDGFDDVAMIMLNNFFGNLILVQSTGTAPSWKQPIYYGIGTATRKLIADDFNADGKKDIAYLGDNSRGIIYNTNSTRRISAIFDYDGDSKSDISVFRPSNGAWYMQNSSTGFYAVAFGANGDKVVPADFSGDGKTDVAVWRNGTWYVFNTVDNTFYGIPFGTTGDIPVPEDFDGDGKADINVFRPSSGMWFRNNSSNGQFVATPFGQNGDVPTVGDFDGDNKADIAVFRPSNGVWYRFNSGSNNSFFAVQFGQTGDKVVPADYTGDGKIDIAVYRGGTWYILRSEDLSFYGIPFGLATDIPTAGDFDGDGKADQAVYRNGQWFIQQSTSGFLSMPFGLPTDTPTESAYSY